MFKSLTGRTALAMALTLSASSAMAVSFALDTESSSNGLTNIYSATIDGGSPPSGLGNTRPPCSGGSPSYCSFFGSDILLGTAVTFTPNPSGLSTNVPAGIAGTPAAGSFIDISLNAGNTLATINGGSVTLEPILINILGGTTVTATDAGFVLAPGAAGATDVAVDANGVAEFLVGVFSGPTVADFSTFSSVTSNCAGPFCALIGLLSLDMNQYRLVVDFDPTFTSFTADFIGQTNNNSLVRATLNSTVVPAPAAGWLLLTAVGGLAARRFGKRGA
jgi:hypothetical protein